MDKRFIFRYHHARSDGGTQQGRYERALWTWSVSRCSPTRAGKPLGHGGKGGTKIPEGGLASSSPHCPEKPLSDEAVVPVPHTDTGR